MPTVDASQVYYPLGLKTSVLADEETGVLLRLRYELKEARDLHGWIDKVHVNFLRKGMAYTKVYFNSEVWPQECNRWRNDCGTFDEPMPLKSVHFDAEKWRKIFRREMYFRDVIERELRKSMSLLALAKFLNHSEIDSIISGINAMACPLPDGRRLTLAIADA